MVSAWSKLIERTRPLRPCGLPTLGRLPDNAKPSVGWVGSVPIVAEVLARGSKLSTKWVSPGVSLATVIWVSAAGSGTGRLPCASAALDPASASSSAISVRLNHRTMRGVARGSLRSIKLYIYLSENRDDSWP